MSCYFFVWFNKLDNIYINIWINFLFIIGVILFFVFKYYVFLLIENCYYNDLVRSISCIYFKIVIDIIFIRREDIRNEYVCKV